MWNSIFQTEHVYNYYIYHGKQETKPITVIKVKKKIKKIVKTCFFFSREKKWLDK